MRTTEQQIETLQEIQTAHPPTSKTWQLASELLQPLFAEMASRPPPGDKTETPKQVCDQCGSEDVTEFYRATVSRAVNSKEVLFGDLGDRLDLEYRVDRVECVECGETNVIPQEQYATQ